MGIEVSSVTKRFKDFTALDDVSLNVQQGEFLALLGPSGSGKTTLLRIIAGLEFPNAGRILFQGQDVSDRSVRERHVGFVFQHYALFKHMTVARNIAFGLSVRPARRRPARAEIEKRVDSLLHLVQLGGLGGRYPSQLSGGQRQRVALARALAIEPRVLLLDEPFGALDAKVRKELRRWLRKLHDDMGITTVFVTHDQEEALEIADRVVVMNKGLIEQVGPAQEVYDAPATPFVYDFLGNTNRLPAAVRGGVANVVGLLVPAPDVPDGAGVAFVRPHEFELRPSGAHGGIEGTIAHVFASGPILRIEVNVPAVELAIGLQIEVEAMRQVLDGIILERGARVALAPRNIKVFKKQD
ncbi:sulfate/molybdate ABC transporter ATP-binding protein [Zavarzinia compransoris]|uniref:Sulfate ABC transporter ATP-binding protein n=1 Tax=Zavarzinia compransoris TaxID=1264899 RepID=A0A317E640_9PROT|nr:sulfate/molybdate ABC transporter ATP-binding protein [Zavarzinia compransoris]PWR20495.1 sulfate ABC transporter ATP-binding protein [Zavarzinia compransoris]TDP43859.1 sulfate transport system ATP-binding protein [Zavarzinia compransoris]